MILHLPFRAGRLELDHRIVMAPLTRCRADPDTLAPTAATAAYYRERATAGGLLITEAVHVSPEGTPVWTIYERVRANGGHVTGLWTDEQERRWSVVVDAVHDRGGRIACQLLHAGRVAQPGIAGHPLVVASGLPVPSVSSSPVVLPCDEGAGEYGWDETAAAPRALTVEEVARVVEDYRAAAVRAVRAGFDAVEVHGAHGYLVDQFICDSVNHRTDEYGGTIENRCRFLFEVVDAVVDVVGEGRVGVRLSPGLPSDGLSDVAGHAYFGATCADPEATYGNAVAGLSGRGLAYLLLTESRVGGLVGGPEDPLPPLRNGRYRDLFAGALLAAGGFTPASAADAIASGACDAVAFGRWFIANPDLVDRIRHGRPLNVYDRATFYGLGPDGAADPGYLDYPTWEMLESGVASRYRVMPQSRISASLRGPRDASGSQAGPVDG